MRLLIYVLVPAIALAFLSYKKTNSRQQPKTVKSRKTDTSQSARPLSYPPDSWPWFLQHLPTENKPILDYKGNQIDNQEKHFAILTYDVGSSDLQQCADALIRLRSEYLFSQKKYAQIGFHFNSGIYYSLADYLKGIRPIFIKRQQILAQTNKASDLVTHIIEEMAGYRIHLCEYRIALQRIKKGEWTSNRNRHYFSRQSRSLLHNYR